MKVSHKEKERNFPDFLVVGTGRAGSTSVHYYLSEHPDVIVPPAKETLFLHIITNPNKSQLQYLPNAITNYDSYLRLYDGLTNTQVCGEVTPSYLYYYKYVIDNVRQLVPAHRTVKIIIILRNPVEKVISQYYFAKTLLGVEKLSLDDALAIESTRRGQNGLPDLLYLDTTKYYESVKAYIDNFEDVHIVFFEDLVCDALGTMRDIYQFVGVDADFVPNIERTYNAAQREFRYRSILHRVFGGGTSRLVNLVAGKQAEHRWRQLAKNVLMEPSEGDDIRRKIKGNLQKDIERLEVLLGRDLSSWI